MDVTNEQFCEIGQGTTMIKLSSRHSKRVNRPILSNGAMIALFLQLLAVVSTLLAQAPSIGQDKYDFKYDDYCDDVGKGFSVADELLASAVRDKVSLAKIASIRMTAGRLALQHKQVKEFYSLSDEREVWKKRKELFLKYVAPVIDSPEDYLTDSESAIAYFHTAEMSCSLLMFSYAENDLANTYADKAFAAIQDSKLNVSQRAFLSTMFKITMADMAYDEDEYDRGDELMKDVVANCEMLMEQDNGRIRIADQARLIFPMMAREKGLRECRHFAKKLGATFNRDEGLTENQRRARQWALLAAETSVYFGKLSEELTKQWIALAKKELEIELDKNAPFFESALAESYGLRSQVVQLIIDEHPEQAVELYKEALDAIQADFDLNTSFTEFHLVEMGNVVIRDLSNRDDDRATRFWNNLRQFLTDSRDRFENRQSVSQVMNNDLRRAKYDYEKYLVRNSVIGKPAPELNADAMIYDGQSTSGPMTLKDFAGKVILLDFWNVSCGPCISGFPRLTEFEQKKGLRRNLWVNIRRSDEFVERFF